MTAPHEIAVRLHDKRRGGFLPQIVATIDTRRRAFIAPVTWRRHYFWKCGSWTFDARSLRDHIFDYQIVDFVVQAPAGRLIYQLHADDFRRRSHSSFECFDTKRQYDEKTHCPSFAFLVVVDGMLAPVTDEIERRFGKPESAPESVTAKQGSLFELKEGVH